MAKLSLEFHDQINPLGFELGSYAKSEIAREFVEAARAEWGDDVWRWYDEHKDVKIVTIHKWFLHFTFRVHHCVALIRAIAGPRPVGLATPTD